MTTKIITGIFRHEDGNWIVEDADDPRIHTFGRTLAKAKANLADAAALWHDIAVEQVEVKAVIPSVEEELEDLIQARAVAAEAEQRVRTLTKCIDTKLSLQGLSLRDAAEVVGLSHQRLHQLRATPESPQKMPSSPSRRAS